MKSCCSFTYPGPLEEIRDRQLLGRSIADFHSQVLQRFQGPRSDTKREWSITLGKNLIFNHAALVFIERALRNYQGSASELEFCLELDDVTYRHFYSLQTAVSSASKILALPLVIERHAQGSTGKERLVIPLPVTKHPIKFPESLCQESEAPVPKLVLIPYENEFDLLFANQIGILNLVAEKARVSPLSWFRALLGRDPKKLSQKIGLNFRQIAPSADIHPTAVIEGSIIGPGAQVGAHCVVRYSYLGSDSKLYDGAKVEFSVVGNRCWLMHDLVLYRSHVENDVFLIHGPYQFSGFQNKSSAFATILMDYRPDRKAIRVLTPKGIREYQGPFLGSILKEGAKTLGGSLISPGLIIPQNTWLSAESKSIHRQLTGPNRPPHDQLINSHSKQAQRQDLVKSDS